MQWYFGGDDSPFLQWVPSSGREPALVGQTEFRTRLMVWSNTSVGGRETARDHLLLEQTVRVERPGVHLSGHYTCKVATFFKEQKSTHQVIIFGKAPAWLPRLILLFSDPGLGPKLTYKSFEGPDIHIYCSGKVLIRNILEIFLLIFFN